MKKKEHMKIMKKATIKIFFNDGKVDEIPAKLWDDYEYRGGSEYRPGVFLVKRRGCWIGIYNMNCVDCIVVG